MDTIITSIETTTILINKETNKRLALLQLQLDLKNRDEIINLLLDYYHENKITKQT
jgi:hypothetical protein